MDRPQGARVTRKLNVGWVGLGNHSTTNLIPALQEVTSARLVAVADIDLTRVRRTTDRYRNVRGYTSFEEMLDAGRLDVVVCASLPAVHEDVLLACAARGIAFFCEKPPAVDLARLQRMAKVAANAGISTGVGMNFRRSASVRWMEAHVAKESNILWLDIKYRCRSRTNRSWKISDPVNEVLLTDGIHPIDMVSYLLAAPKLTHNSTDCSKEGIRMLASGEGSKGARWSISLIAGAPRFSFSVEILLEDARSYRLSLPDGAEFEERLSSAELRTELWRPKSMTGGYQQAGYRTELQEFMESIVEGKRFTPAIDDLMPTYSIIDTVVTEHQKARLYQS